MRNTLPSSPLLLRSIRSQHHLLWVLLCSLLLTGCSSKWTEHIPFLYRTDVEQGNTIDQQSMDSIQVGMTKKQVIAILGTPLLVDNLNPDRFEYIYTLIPAEQNEPVYKRISVTFADDRVVGLDGTIGLDEPQVLQTNQTRILTVPKKQPKSLWQRFMDGDWDSDE